MATKSKRKKGDFGLTAMLVSAGIALASLLKGTADTVQSNKETRKQSRLADEQAAAQQRTEDTEALDQSLNAEVENEEQGDNNINDAIDNQDVGTTNQSGEEKEQESNGRFKRGGKVSMSRTKHNKIFSCGGRRRADYGTYDDENKKSGRGANVAAGVLGSLAQAGQTFMNIYGIKQQSDILKKLGNNTTTIENNNINNNNNTNTSSNIVTANSNSILPDYAANYTNRNRFAVNNNPYQLNDVWTKYRGKAGGRFANRSYIRTTKKCC